MKAARTHTHTQCLKAFNISPTIGKSSSETFSLSSIISLAYKGKCIYQRLVTFIEEQFVLIISSRKSHHEHSRNKTPQRKKGSMWQRKETSLQYVTEVIQQESTYTISLSLCHNGSLCPIGNLSGNQNSHWVKITSLHPKFKSSLDP